MDNKEHQIIFNISGGTQANIAHTITIETQNNTYSGNDMKTQSIDSHSPSAAASPLATEEAMAIWQKTAAKGWTDTQGNLIDKKLSYPKAALLANLIGEKLGIKPLWPPFEKFWGINNLANNYSRSFSNQYKDQFENEVKEVIA